MQFKSFTFRAEWLEAADALGDVALKAELLLAITTYGVTGEYTPSHSPVINALMTIIKAQIDATPSRRKAIKQMQAEMVAPAIEAEPVDAVTKPVQARSAPPHEKERAQGSVCVSHRPAGVCFIESS